MIDNFQQNESSHVFEPAPLNMSIFQYENNPNESAIQRVVYIGKKCLDA